MAYHAVRKSVVIAGAIIVLLALVVHDGRLLAASNSDAVYREKLVGTWTQRDSGPEATLERTVTFLADGSYRSSAQLTKQKEVIEHQNRGSWSIEKGVLYITVLESTRTDIPLGHKTPNRIITLTETEVITESAEGVRTTAYRVR
jgi:hypothetical protein